jgi:hypothetical protein
VSRRRVLEVAFILLDSPSPLRRIFISSHSLPPFLVHRIGPSKGLLLEEGDLKPRRPVMSQMLINKFQCRQENAREKE